MRYLLLGNRDNLNTRLLKWMSDAGLDCELWCVDPQTLRSDPKTYLGKEYSKYQNKIKTIVSIKMWLIPLYIGEYRSQIEKNFDVVIVCGGIGLLFSNAINLPKVLTPVGSELAVMPFLYKKWRLKDNEGHLFRWFANCSNAYFTRRALSKLSGILGYLKTDIEFLKRQNLWNRCVNIIIGENIKFSLSNTNENLLNEITEKSETKKRTFLWLSRLDFRDPESSMYKGVDRFLRALANNKDLLKQIRIVMLDFGADKDAAKELARDLGIFDNIEWVSHLDLPDLLAYLSIPNAVLFPVFGDRHNEMGGVARDAIVTGTVMIASFTDESTKEVYGAPVPKLYARTVEEAAEQMRVVFEMDDQEFQDLQEKVRDYGMQYLSHTRYLKRLDAAVQACLQGNLEEMRPVIESQM